MKARLGMHGAFARRASVGALILLLGGWAVLAAEEVLELSPEPEQVPEVSPEMPLLLGLSDLKDAGALAQRLRAAPDPVARYVAEQCSVHTRQLLNAYQGTGEPDQQLRQLMVQDINRLLLTEPLYDPQRFAGVELSEDTRQLLQERETVDRLRLNRLLLEDAFPDELIRLTAWPFDVRADVLELEGAQRLLVASGQVHIRQDDTHLRSEHAVINLDTLDVVADGQVTLERGSDLWVGQKLRYNFQTHQGDFGGFAAYLEPFYVRAQTSYQTSEREYVLEHAILTPCAGEHPKAHLRARKVRIDPGHHIRAQHVVLYVSGVPVMYAPYWSQNIGDPNFISMVPGYNRRMWAYLLTAFNYRISKKVEAASHVDLRLRRGLALGQDIMWTAGGNAQALSTERYLNPTPDEPWAFTGHKYWEDTKPPREYEDAWFGDAIVYYAQDAWPHEDKQHDYPIDHDRYRMRLYHSHSLSERDYFLVQLDYLSDPKFIEQFFRKEYKAAPEPDNYLVLGHHGEHYALSLEVERRLNDFYTGIDRLPFLTLDLPRQQIGESPFYYQGKTTAGYLSKEWESNITDQQNYDAFRFDTDHTIYYPRKLFGFLTFTPRAGYRGTWYSATKQDYTNQLLGPRLDTNGVAVISNAEASRAHKQMERLGAQYRNLAHLGLETSLKAFRVWDTYPGDIINDVRHIAEPYANYTWMPEPDLLATNLYPFDSVDGLGLQHDIRLGLRNKIQTRRRTVYDLIYADVWTHYRLERQPGQQVFSNLAFEVRSTPFDWVVLKIDGVYDTHQNLIQNFNTRFTVLDKTFWSYEVEHRYQDEGSSLLCNSLTIAPHANWRFSIYCRYEFEDSTLEEYGLSVQRHMGCLSARLGLNWLDDDFDVWLQFWFTDFPKVRVDAGL